LICGVPIALITLVDKKREWYKAKTGITLKENPTNAGFGVQTILHHDLMVVSDTHKDDRFSLISLVTSEPYIRFYAGVPVRAPSGEALGTLCVLDRETRQLNPLQLESLRMLARQLTTILEFRRKTIMWDCIRAEANKMEQCPRLSLDRQTAFLSSADVSIIATDEQGIIIFFNRAAQRMLGYSADEVVGKHTPTPFHDKNEISARAAALSTELNKTIAPGFEAFIAKARTGHADEREWTYVRKNGSRLPVELSVTSIFGAEGGIISYLGIAHNITRRKEAEARLHHSVRFTRSILDALSKQFCVLDENGNILEVNKPWLDYEHEHEGSQERLDIAAIEDVARIAQKTINMLAQPFSIEDNDIVVTASVGISVFPGDGEKQSDAADERRYGDVSGQGTRQESLSVLYNGNNDTVHRTNDG
jgi:PAS domain S-box-containing protein